MIVEASWAPSALALLGEAVPDGGSRLGHRETGRRMTTGGGGTKTTLACSFCGKSQDQVGKLIAGPKAFICDECIELCVTLLRDLSNSPPVVKTVNGAPAPKED